MHRFLKAVFPKRKKKAAENDKNTEPTGNDNAEPTGNDNAAPTGNDNTAPTGNDNTAPTGNDNTAPTGNDNTAPTGNDNTAPTGNDNTAPTDNNKTAPTNKKNVRFAALPEPLPHVQRRYPIGPRPPYPGGSIRPKHPGLIIEPPRAAPRPSRTRPSPIRPSPTRPSPTRPSPTRQSTPTSNSPRLNTAEEAGDQERITKPGSVTSRSESDSGRTSISTPCSGKAMASSSRRSSIRTSSNLPMQQSVNDG